MAKMVVGMIRRASRAAAAAAPTGDDEPGDADPDPVVQQQKKTFRRWVNQYLAEREITIKNILTDWENGVALCHLMEVLAHTQLPKINATPKLELQKLENLNHALAFIGKHVKIVNIGSRDILTGNQTIILGLIWTLIVRWGVRLKDGKAGLLAWVNEKTGAEATNFTKDWLDGMLMARLVAAVCPGKLDLSMCSPDAPMSNFEKSFDVLDKELDVAKLLDPKDLQEKIDEKSLVAYVGQIHKNLNRDPNELATERLARVVASIKAISMAAPRAFNITPVTADIEWTIPQGKGITAVKVQVAPEDASTAWPQEPGEDNKEVFEDRTSTTFTGLKPQHTYVVRVVGLHSTGKLTEPSETVTFTTLEAGAPPAPKLYDVETDKITCEWVAVPTATAYTVVVDVADAHLRDVRVQGEQSTKVVVDGLEPGAVYSFRVVASLPGKDTSPSAASQEKTRMPSAAAGAVAYEVQVRDADQPWDQAEAAFAPLSVDAAHGDAVRLAELEPDKRYEVRVVAVSAAGVASEPSPATAFATEGPAPRYALVTGANSKLGLEIVQSLLLMSTTSGGEVGASTTFGFADGFAKVFCLARDPPLPELAHLAMETRTLVVVPVDVGDAVSLEYAAKLLPNKVDLLINNAGLPKSIVTKLLS